jgi:hypothetical protein
LAGYLSSHTNSRSPFAVNRSPFTVHRAHGAWRIQDIGNTYGSGERNRR